MPEAGRSDFSEMLKIRGVPSDEPVFLLRAQDTAAADTVRAWAAISHGLEVPEAVLEQALSQADAMDAWPHKKPADADHLSEGEAKRLAYEFGRRAWNDRQPVPSVQTVLAEQRGAQAALAPERMKVRTSDPVVQAMERQYNTLADRFDLQGKDLRDAHAQIRELQGVIAALQAELKLRPPSLPDEILKALAVRPSGVMTYVVGNVLRRERGMDVTTTAIRCELLRMEAAGLVERAPSNYARQICWRKAKPAPAAEAPAQEAAHG